MKKLPLILLLFISFTCFSQTSIIDQYTQGKQIVSDSIGYYPTSAGHYIDKITTAGRWWDLWNFTLNVYDSLVNSATGVTGARLADSTDAVRNWVLSLPNIGATVSSITFSSPLIGGTITTTGTVSIPASSSSSSGYLPSSDWVNFNNKQSALVGSGFVKIIGTTISYDNSIYALASTTLTINGTAQDLSTSRNFLVTDANLSTSNVTTNNASTSKHGFVPILPNDATKYYDGSGSYSVPVGSVYSAGVGLGLLSGVFSVTPTQAITGLTTLTSNGYVKTIGGAGTLSISTTIPYTDITGVPSFLTAANATSPITSSGGTTPTIGFQTVNPFSIVANTTSVNATPSSYISYTTAATASTIVQRNGSGQVVGDITGNSATVTTIPNLSGDITSSGNVTSYNNIVSLSKGGTAATTTTSLNGTPITYGSNNTLAVGTGTVQNVISGTNISIGGTSTIQPTINISGIIGLSNGGTAASTTTTLNGTPITYGALNTITASANTLTSTTLNPLVVHSSLTDIGTLTAGSIPYSLITGIPILTLTINGTPMSIPNSYTITSSANTLTSTTLNPTVVHSSLIDFGISPTLVTPLIGTPTSGTLTNCIGLPEGGLSLTDITTNNASISNHGFLKKLNGNGAYYMGGDGNWNIPVGTTYTGTANRITVSGTSIDIAATYTGQSSITTVGTLASGSIPYSLVTSTPDLSVYVPYTGASSDVALGLHSITMTGSLGTTGARLIKGWFTDLQVTNPINGSITGNAATVTTNANLTGPITSAGNATAIANGTITAAMLANTAVTPGSYGSATQAPTYTVDAQGRLTAASNTIISGVAPGGAAGGDLTGTYPNPTLAIPKLNDLPPVAVQTASMTATANTFVPVDISGGSFTVKLPNAPVDGTVVEVKVVKFAGTNTVTVACQGSDVFNVASGSTTGTLSFLNQAGTWRYKSSTAIWYGINDIFTKTYADATYAPIASPTFTGTVTIPTPFNLGAISVTSKGGQLNYLSAATGTTGTTSTNIMFSTSPTVDDQLTIGAASGTTGSIALKGTTSGTVTIKPADAAGTWTMKLPTTAGTNLYVLQTDGAGVCSWVAQSGGGGVTFSTSTFTSQTSVTITHSSGHYAIVQVLDNSGNVYLPDNISQTTTAFTITFTTAKTGTILYSY